MASSAFSVNIILLWGLLSAEPTRNTLTFTNTEPVLEAHHDKDFPVGPILVYWRVVYF